MAIEYHNAGDATKQAPVKMLRQSSCLYMSAAEVLDQVFRQRKRSDESTQAADDQRTYVVVDFRTTEELESQAVLRHSSVRLPCHVFEEDADEAVTGLLRRISSLLHRIGESEFGKSDSNSSGSRGPALLFTKTSAPSAATAFSTSSPVTPARLSTMAGAGREAPHLVVMARGGKKSSGLNLAEKLVVCGCLYLVVLLSDQLLASRFTMFWFLHIWRSPLGALGFQFCMGAFVLLSNVFKDTITSANCSAKHVTFAANGIIFNLCGFAKSCTRLRVDVLSFPLISRFV